MCFDFLYNFSETILIPTRIWGDDINMHRSSCKLHILLKRFERNKFSDRFSKNTQISTITKIHPLGTELFHADGLMNRQT
jgi:hypothetical protein